MPVYEYDEKVNVASIYRCYYCTYNTHHQVFFCFASILPINSPPLFLPAPAPPSLPPSLPASLLPSLHPPLPPPPRVLLYCVAIAGVCRFSLSVIRGITKYSTWHGVCRFIV